MSLWQKIRSWLLPARGTVESDDAQRARFDEETIKTSALRAPPMLKGEKNPFAE